MTNNDEMSKWCSWLGKGGYWMQRVTKTTVILAVIATGLSCERAVDQSYVAYQLIEEDQTRCHSLANRVATIWSDSLGTERTSISLAAFYLDEGAPLLAAISAAEGQITAVMSKIDRSKNPEAISVLLDAYSLNQSMCDLATNPVGRSLLTFNNSTSELQDDYSAVSSKLRILMDEPSEVTRLAIEHHRSVINMAKRSVIEEQQHREIERKERERVRKEVTREALLRRRQTEKEIRAQENEQLLADAAAQARRQRQDQEAQRLAVEERRRKEADEQKQREHAAAQRLRQIQIEMQHWHLAYIEAMEPIRTAVGEVNDAWSRPTASAQPACRRLSRELSELDRSPLLESPDATLNSRLKAMLNGFEEAAPLCQRSCRLNR